jgi:hypothetical protein
MMPTAPQCAAIRGSQLTLTCVSQSASTSRADGMIPMDPPSASASRETGPADAPADAFVPGAAPAVRRRMSLTVTV